MAEKKIKRGTINKAPNGVSFRFKPRKISGEHNTCFVCGEGRIALSEGGFPTCNEGSVFICDHCDFITPDGYTHAPTKPQTLWPKRKPTKKQRPHEDSVELRDAIRAEVRKRAKLLNAERKKFPSTFCTGIAKKGKLKGKRVYWDNPKFTDKMREHMHSFAYSAEEIREELLAKGMK